MAGHKITQLSDLRASNHNKTRTSCDGSKPYYSSVESAMQRKIFLFHHISNTTDESIFYEEKWISPLLLSTPYYLKVRYENLCIWWLVPRRGIWAVIINWQLSCPRLNPLDVSSYFYILQISIKCIKLQEDQALSQPMQG